MSTEDKSRIDPSEKGITVVCTSVSQSLFDNLWDKPVTIKSKESP